jgi:hypothetical protein
MYKDAETESEEGQWLISHCPPSFLHIQIHQQILFVYLQNVSRLKM